MDKLFDALEQRQQEEKDKLQDEIKLMMKGAKKGKKKELEAQAMQMEYELRVKHVDELNFLEENGFIEEIGKSMKNDGSDGIISESTLLENQMKDIAIVQSDHETDPTDGQSDPAYSKKEKAKRKKDKKAQKDKDKLEEKEKYRESVSALPNQKEIESSQLNLLLSAEGMEVKPVQADGHCLYRAVADQLTQLSSSGKLVSSVFALDTISFVDIRKIAAAYMRSHVDEYAPFLGFAGPCVEYDAYCSSVESVISAEWGGETELNAIAACLRVPIWVYEVGRPVLKMGSAFEDSNTYPLKLVYHPTTTRWGSTTILCSK